jgi:hypothetical protein
MSEALSYVEDEDTELVVSVHAHTAIGSRAFRSATPLTYMECSIPLHIRFLCPLLKVISKLSDSSTHLPNFLLSAPQIRFATSGMMTHFFTFTSVYILYLSSTHPRPRWL